MTIGTVHPFFQMYVLEMDRHSGPTFFPFLFRTRLHRLLQLLIGHISYDVPLVIQQIPFPVTLEHRAEIPPVPMVVGKLCMFELTVELTHLCEKFWIRPLPSNGCLFRISIENLPFLFLSWVLLLLRPHRFAIGLVIPHCVTQIAIHEDVGLMHMARHALACRNGFG